MRKMTWRKCLEEVVINSWWLILCMLIGGFVYDRAMHALKQEEQRLRKRAADFHSQIALAEQKQHALRLHIQNWDNPSIVESALILKLGLIPKDYTKVCFIPSNKTSRHID